MSCQYHLVWYAMVKPKDSPAGSPLHLYRHLVGAATVVEELGDRVRQLRRALGNVSQETLAHKIGTTTRTVARWEKAKTIPVEALSLLRRAAVEAGEAELVRFFDVSIFLKLNLDIQYLDFIPQDSKEMILVGALLRRVRRQGYGYEAVVDQLRAWQAEDEFEKKPEERRPGLGKQTRGMREQVPAKQKEKS